MPRSFLSLIVCLVLALPCPGQEGHAQPKGLTPREIAEGWILLFDGETTFGWVLDGETRIKDGVLKVGGAKPARLTTTTSLGFGETELECRWSGANEPTFTYAQIGKLFQEKKGGPRPGWKSDVWTRISASIQAVGEQIVVGYARKQLDESVGWRALGKTKQPPASLKLRPFQIDVPADSFLEVRHVRHRPLAMKPLFNGKDLEGWTVFPKKKSTFAVVDGAINVKDGPGDLQTTGKYQDFVLQLECKSNGKHLNSGIFFRCRDSEYQNGYEAQIRNQFMPEATQKYLIEEYDPKTNKLLGKKEQLYSAVDFGTGAIYRRQPARKEMSKDGEWFGMTIVAQGNRFATWVNGVQVTDWTDHRPPSDNARTGFRREGGHLSIQGHDPTTDLSFRNFRIAEFPVGK